MSTRAENDMQLELALLASEVNSASKLVGELLRGKAKPTPKQLKRAALLLTAAAEKAYALVEE